MRKVSIFGLVIFLLLILPSYASSVETFTIGLWKPHISGWIKDSGENVDTDSDLHLTSKRKPYGSFKVEGIPFLPDMKVQVTTYKFLGSGAVNRGFTFGSVKAEASGTVKSKLDITDISLYYFYQPINFFRNDRLNLEVGLRLAFVDAEALIKYREGSTTSVQDDNTSALIPAIHLASEFRLTNSIGVQVNCDAIQLSNRKLVDFFSQVKYYLTGGFFIGCGYKYQKLKVEDRGGVDFNLRLNGIFANLGVLF